MSKMAYSIECISKNKKNENAKIPAPGSPLKRFCKSFLIQFKIVLSYRLGLDFLKALRSPCPKVDTSLKQSGKVCVMTGASRGIGIEVLKLLLELDYTVILGVRNLEAMQMEIETIHKSGIVLGKTIIFHLDLKSLKSVKRFSQQILHQVDRIDLLVNHAGIFQDNYEITEDELECHFQVNYLSQFLLTQELLPCIKETALRNPNSTCHIVNTSSWLGIAGKLEFENLAKAKLYVPIKCYCDTKLCQVMHAISVQENLNREGISNIQMYSVHPGEIPTEMWREYGKIEGLIHPLAQRVCRTKQEAANIILYAALCPTLSKTCGGQYFDRDQPISPNPQALKPNLRKRLWQLSTDLISKNTNNNQHRAYGA